MNYRLHQSMGYQLSLAARLQERRLEEGLRSLGLTRTTWCVLLAVGNEGLAHPSDIARFIGIDRTATSRALRNMDAERLIERVNGIDDRRTTTVRLTDAGFKKLAAGTPFAMRNNEIMQRKLSDADKQELMRLLAQLIEGEDTDLKVF